MPITLALKVTPQSLENQATVVEDAIRSVVQEVNQAFQALEDSRNYWKGPAGDLHRTILDEKEGYEALLGKIEGYPGRLRTIAGLYSTAESENVATSEQLGTDVTLV